VAVTATVRGRGLGKPTHPSPGPSRSPSPNRQLGPLPCPASTGAAWWGCHSRQPAPVCRQRCRLQDPPWVVPHRHLVQVGAPAWVWVPAHPRTDPVGTGSPVVRGWEAATVVEGRLGPTGRSRVVQAPAVGPAYLLPPPPPPPPPPRDQDQRQHQVQGRYPRRHRRRRCRLRLRSRHRRRRPRRRQRRSQRKRRGPRSCLPPLRWGQSRPPLAQAQALHPPRPPRPRREVAWCGSMASGTPALAPGPGPCRTSTCPATHSRGLTGPGPRPRAPLAPPHLRT
jgi:hypothetical protein